MTEKEQQMQGFLSKAAKIIKKSDAVAPIVPSKYIPNSPEARDIESLIGGIDRTNMYEQQEYSEVQPVYNEQRQNSVGSKMPRSILESIENNPIQDYNSSMGNSMGTLSVLDSFMPKAAPRQQPQRQPINEDYYQDEKPMPSMDDKIRQMRESNYQQPQQTYQPQNVPIVGGVDYSLIKIMLEDIVSKEFQKLKRTMLTESKQTNDNVIIKMGDDIRFVTSKGKVYAGNLKFIGEAPKQ